jgi:DNA-binding Lrp family transcriptional regulator
MDKLLRLIEKDCRYSPEQLASMCGLTAGEVTEKISEYERNGTVLGYKALVDWDKTDREYVSALIELKVAPQRDRGFDKIAQLIYNYPEVQSLYLMSGGFDLMLVIEGQTMRDVAYFVAYKLAPMEDIISTATHFVLKKYKDKGVIYRAPQRDEREELL